MPQTVPRNKNSSSKPNIWRMNFWSQSSDHIFKRNYFKTPAILKSSLSRKSCFQITIFCLLLLALSLARSKWSSTPNSFFLHIVMRNRELHWSDRRKESMNVFAYTKMIWSTWTLLKTSTKHRTKFSINWSSCNKFKYFLSPFSSPLIRLLKNDDKKIMKFCMPE